MQVPGRSDHGQEDSWEGASPGAVLPAPGGLLGERAESRLDPLLSDLGFARMTVLLLCTHQPEAVRCSGGLTSRVRCQKLAM